MRRKPSNSIVTMGLAAIMTVSGCGGSGKRLDREALVDPPPARSYRVTTRDGRDWTFIALHLERNVLVGTVRITTAATEGEGEAARTNVTNRYEEVELPWDEVVAVEAEGTRKNDAGFLIAGATIVVGILAFLLLTSDGPGEPDPGDGKDF